jgi:hypothetical protein
VEFATNLKKQVFCFSLAVLTVVQTISKKIIISKKSIFSLIPDLNFQLQGNSQYFETSMLEIGQFW